MSTNFKKFAALCSASLISATGSGMTSFALGVYIYRKTQMSTAAGLLILLGFAPNLMLSPIAGVLADRYDRRLLMMLGDGLSMIGLFVIWIFVHLNSSGTLPIPSLITGICTGVAISSCFSSLIEPAFKATVSDLLEKDEYSKASGLTQLCASARYLLSPIFAGFLLSIAGIDLILLIDILTICLTLPVTYWIRKEMRQKNERSEVFIGKSLRSDLKTGFDLIYRNKGIWTLVVFGILVSFCLGTIQTLMTPMILGFADEVFLGFSTTFSAFGILVGSLILGKYGVTKHVSRILSLSLFMIGLFMIGFCIREDKWTVCGFGFLLFCSLPFANMSIDYLVRSNTSKDHQGKIWGMIGIISQSGYIAAYSISGVITDYFTNPLLAEGGQYASTLGRMFGIGEGRGAALVIAASGCFLCLNAFFLSKNQAVKQLEEEHVPKAI